MSKFDERGHRELESLRACFKDYWAAPADCFGFRQAPDALVRRIEALETERSAAISELVEAWKESTGEREFLCYYAECYGPMPPYGGELPTILPTVTKIIVPLPPNNVEWRDLILWHEAEKFLVRMWNLRR